MATQPPVYLFKRVKHSAQNILNDCQQWLCDSFREHQIRFQLELRPGPRWRSLQRSPRLSIGGLLSLLPGRRGERGEKERKQIHGSALDSQASAWGGGLKSAASQNESGVHIAMELV